MKLLRHLFRHTSKKQAGILLETAVGDALGFPEQGLQHYKTRTSSHQSQNKVSNRISLDYYILQNYLVMQEHYWENHHIRQGNVIRLEKSKFTEIMRVKQLVASKLDSKPCNTILFHLDSLNLSAFEEKEINRIYTPIP